VTPDNFVVDPRVLDLAARAPGISFGVITRVPDPPELGNLAAALDVFIVTDARTSERGYAEAVERVPPQVAVNLRAPVFTLGEVLVLGSDGRELVSPGRMPSKWDVDCETYADVNSAIIRSWQVTGRL
jgi:hypothetical protein